MRLMKVQCSLSFSSVFGLLHLLWDISGWSVAKCSTEFASCSLIVPVCCLAACTACSLTTTHTPWAGSHHEAPKSQAELRLYFWMWNDSWMLILYISLSGCKQSLQLRYLCGVWGVNTESRALTANWLDWTQWCHCILSAHRKTIFQWVQTETQPHLSLQDNGQRSPVFCIITTFHSYITATVFIDDEWTFLPSDDFITFTNDKWDAL